MRSVMMAPGTASIMTATMARSAIAAGIMTAVAARMTTAAIVWAAACLCRACCKQRNNDENALN